jgi:hypothetical protein
MKFKLRSGDYIGLLIMFLSLGELWPQVVQWQLLALIQQMEMEVLAVVEPLEMVELPGWWCRASTSTHGPLPIFNQVVEFFHELQLNYKGVRTEKLRSLQDL